MKINPKENSTKQWPSWMPCDYCGSKLTKNGYCRKCKQYCIIRVVDSPQDEIQALRKENHKLKEQIIILEDIYFMGVVREYVHAFFKKFFAERILPDLLKKTCDNCGYACTGKSVLAPCPNCQNYDKWVPRLDGKMKQP